MKISFHGAARTVTGSKHLVTLTDGRNILLDCGMLQGMGSETAQLNAGFGFDPASVSIVLLSHAHIDHSGLIPKLVKEGFTGKVVCTAPTKDLTDILLHDSAEIQSYDAGLNDKRNTTEPYLPLYNTQDVENSLQQFETVDYNVWFTVMEGVDVLFTSTGHLIGSTAITLRIKEGRKKTTILYSGDVGRYQSILLHPPADAPQADYIILESTYGDKYHNISFKIIDALNDWIKKICLQRGGQLIIPAFSVGRTQEILYALNQLYLEKRLPDVPCFVDSPLSLKATQTIKKYKEQFNDKLQHVLQIDDDPFEFPGLKYIETIEDSRRLVGYKEPCVIISASGTADAGRVRHHINGCISNKNCGILLVGYCGSHSLGGQLISGANQVEIFYKPCVVHAEVGQLPGMSAHGDMDDLTRFISNQAVEKIKAIFLVHGEEQVQITFAERLLSKGFKRVESPSMHQEFELPLKRKRLRKRISVTKLKDNSEADPY